LEQLEKICSMESSFKVLRLQMSDVSPPCVPYIGTYLGDLTFIEDGNPDWINGNMINWEKRKLQYTILSKIDQYQRTAYNFRRVVDIQKLFTIAAVYNDKELFDRSLELEPRNALKSQIQ